MEQVGELDSSIWSALSADNTSGGEVNLVIVATELTIKIEGLPGPRALITRACPAPREPAPSSVGTLVVLRSSSPGHRRQGMGGPMTLASGGPMTLAISGHATSRVDP